MSETAFLVIAGRPASSRKRNYRSGGRRNTERAFEVPEVVPPWLLEKLRSIGSHEWVQQDEGECVKIFGVVGVVRGTLQNPFAPWDKEALWQWGRFMEPLDAYTVNVSRIWRAVTPWDVHTRISQHNDECHIGINVSERTNRLSQGQLFTTTEQRSWGGHDVVDEAQPAQGTSLASRHSPPTQTATAAPPQCKFHLPPPLFPQAQHLAWLTTFLAN